MSVIEVRPNNGGQDAEDFAASLTASIHKALVRQGYRVDKDSFSTLERAFVLSSNAPVKVLRWLEGVHTVQRIPKGSAARHTSSATIVVRQEVEVKVDEVNMDDLRIDRYRGHGKGGQHRNKVSTAVRVVHKPTGIVVTRENGRSQDANLSSALEQLQEELKNRAQGKAQQNLAGARAVLEEGSKAFTHNAQRSEVVHHATGRRWSMKSWNAGKIDLVG